MVSQLSMPDAVRSLFDYVDRSPEIRLAMNRCLLSITPAKKEWREFGVYVRESFKASAAWTHLSFLDMHRLLVIVDRHRYYATISPSSLDPLDDDAISLTLPLVSYVSSSLFTSFNTIPHGFTPILWRRMQDLERVCSDAAEVAAVRVSLCRSIAKYGVGLTKDLPDEREDVRDAMSSLSHATTPLVAHDRHRVRVGAAAPFVVAVENVLDAWDAKKLSAQDMAVELEKELAGARSVASLLKLKESLASLPPARRLLFATDTLVDVMTPLTDPKNDFPFTWGLASLSILFLRLVEDEEGHVPPSLVHNLIFSVTVRRKRLCPEDNHLLFSCLSHCNAFLFFRARKEKGEWNSDVVKKRWHNGHMWALNWNTPKRFSEYAEAFLRRAIEPVHFADLFRETAMTVVTSNKLVPTATNFLSSILLSILRREPKRGIFDFMHAFEEGMPSEYPKKLTVRTVYNLTFFVSEPVSRGKIDDTTLMARLQGIVKLFLCHASNFISRNKHVDLGAPWEAKLLAATSTGEERRGADEKAAALCEEEERCREREAERKAIHTEKRRSKKKRREANKVVRKAEGEEAKLRSTREKEQDERREKKSESDANIRAAIAYARKDIQEGVPIEDAVVRVRKAMSLHHNTCSEEAKAEKEVFKEEITQLAEKKKKGDSLLFPYPEEDHVLRFVISLLS